MFHRCINRHILIYDSPPSLTLPLRRLLARLCLVREEIRWLGLETSFTSRRDPPPPPSPDDGQDDKTPAPSPDDERGEEGGGGSEAASSTSDALRFFRTNVPQVRLRYHPYPSTRIAPPV